MAQRGTTPIGKGGKSPLTKQKTNGPSAHANQDNFADIDRVNKDLVQGLTESEVEIDHLKTTVIAINEKIEVIYNFHINNGVFCLFKAKTQNVDCMSNQVTNL